MFRYVMICMTAVCSLGLIAQEQPAVQLKEMAPYPYLCVEVKGDYAQHETAFMTLYEQTGMQGIVLNNDPFGIYYNNPTNVPVDSLVWEIGSAVAGLDSVGAPLVLKTWPHTRVASIVYDGPFDDALSAQYGLVYTWIAQNGYQVAGPLQEIFLSMPSQNADGQFTGQVEIVIPVTK